MTERVMAAVEVNPHSDEFNDVYGELLDKALKARGDGQTFADLMIAASILGVSMGVTQEDADFAFRGIWLSIAAHHKDATDADRAAYEEWLDASMAAGKAMESNEGRLH